MKTQKFTVHIYSDIYIRQVQVADETGQIVVSHCEPGMTHTRALEIAHDEVRLHSDKDTNIVDHWNCQLLCGVFPEVHSTGA